MSRKNKAKRESKKIVAASVTFLKELPGIDRIWAHLGRVWVRTSTGVEKTWSPREAAEIALTCGVLSDQLEISAQEHMILIEIQTRLTEAVLEAKKQQVSPSDTLTAAVTDAIVGSAALNVHDEAQAKMVAQLKPFCPKLNFDEILFLLRAYPDKTLEWYRGLLMERNAYREQYELDRFQKQNKNAVLQDGGTTVKELLK